MTQTATKTVLILARYELKNSESIIYSVRNGENKEYCVALHASGNTTCTCKHGIHAGNAAHCYHVQECQKAEAVRLLPTEAKMNEMCAYYEKEAALAAQETARCYRELAFDSRF